MDGLLKNQEYRKMTPEEEEEEYKRVTVTVEQVDELPSKVKYKTILEEEDDFLPE
jgi:hypothetical protein